MITTSKNMYINKLPQLVDKYKNTIHGLINIKHGYVKPDTHVDFDNKVNAK